MYKEHSQMN